MNNSIDLIIATVAGFLLGAFFFGGLWWTVQKAVAAKNTAFWFIVSWLLRSTITVAGFFWITHGDWQKTLACLAGFFIARFFVIRYTRKPTTTESIHGNQP